MGGASRHKRGALSPRIHSFVDLDVAALNEAMLLVNIFVQVAVPRDAEMRSARGFLLHNCRWQALVMSELLSDNY